MSFQGHLLCKRDIERKNEVQETCCHKCKNIIYAYILYDYTIIDIKQECVNISIFLVLNCRRYHSTEIHGIQRLAVVVYGKVYTYLLVTHMVKTKILYKYLHRELIYSKCHNPETHIIKDYKIKTTHKSYIQI